MWEGIEEAERIGFNPIKINVVAMKGVNEDEIVDFARLTFTKPYHIRFIEFMPIGKNNSWSAEKFIPAGEILERIRTLGDLAACCAQLHGRACGKIQTGRGPGEVGVIAALSHHFCNKCNRLRLTAEGHIRGCLFSDGEIDLKTPLRQKKPDAYILELLKSAMRNKPESHGLGQSGPPRKCVRQMSSIGG